MTAPSLSDAKTADTTDGTTGCRSGINHGIVQHKLQVQCITLTLAISLTLAVGNHAILTAVPFSMQGLGESMSSLSLALLTAVPLVATDAYWERVSDRRDAAMRHFSSAHTAFTLFGRRAGKEKTDARRVQDQLPQVFEADTSTTYQVLESSTILSLASAFSEHFVFRHMLLLHLCLVVPLPLAILLQGLLYGVFQSLIAGGKTPSEEFGLELATQTLYGSVMGACYALTGFQNALIPMLANIVLSLHLWNASWHACNNQLDWIDKNCNSDQRIADSSFQQSPTYYLERFFYAFDTQHQYALSMHDVQRAVAYAFPNQPEQSSHVKKLFHQLEHEAGSGGIGLTEFRKLLSILKAMEQREVVR